MRRLWLMVPLAAVIASGCFAQQQTNPTLDPHPSDNATFGNKKQPKKDKAPTSRTVSGQVTDEGGHPLEGAMVTLTDKATNERTTFFTKKDGRYQFEELGFNKDYSVQAKYKDAASDERKVSQFDNTPRPVRILLVKTDAQANGNAAASSANR